MNYTTQLIGLLPRKNALMCLALAMLLTCGCNSDNNPNPAQSNNSRSSPTEDGSNIESSKLDSERSVARQQEQMDPSKLLESIIGLSEKELVQRIGEPTEGWQSYVPDRGFQYLDFFEKTPRHLIVRFNEDDKVLSAERAPSFFGPPPG